MSDRWDVIGLAGLALLAAGGFWAWAPLLLLIPGAVLVFIAWRGSSRAST